MRVDITPGKYIVAVSGGVDSMVLLDLARQKPGLELVVAHFNHGIRDDVSQDEKLASKVAKSYDLPLEIGYGNLGPRASEDQARQARYGFLKSVAVSHHANRILTGHHQDDMIETALINLLRGTGRRGLSSIATNPEVYRPLLGYSKQSLVRYATVNKLEWREDSTNQEDKYLRNQLRNQVLLKLTSHQRVKLVELSDKVANNGKAQEELIAKISRKLNKNGNINRRLFSELPPEVADELLIYWLRERSYLSYQRKTIRQLNTAIRTAKPSTSYSLGKGLGLIISKQEAHFEGSP